MFRKMFVAIPIVVMAVSGTACASKKFVRTSVGEVNDKVDSVGRAVEETQERTRKNEGRISEVDQKADAAHQAARQANDAATAAHSAATAVGGRVDDMDKSNRRLVYEVVLNEDSGNFKFGKTCCRMKRSRRSTRWSRS